MVFLKAFFFSWSNEEKYNFEIVELLFTIFPGHMIYMNYDYSNITAKCMVIFTSLYFLAFLKALRSKRFLNSNQKQIKLIYFIFKKNLSDNLTAADDIKKMFSSRDQHEKKHEKSILTRRIFDFITSQISTWRHVVKRQRWRRMRWNV